jgi:hypothetical protein
MTQPWPSGSFRRPRRGFVLPFVLVALLVVAAIAGATGLGAWRAMRAARLAWNGERAALAADEALALAAADWDGEAFAESAIGTRWARTITTADAASVDVALVRTGPLTVAMEATARSSVSGSPDTAHRRTTRVFSFDTPRVPLLGALTVLGSVQVTGSASLDGRDILAASDGCAPERDSASVPGLYAGSANVAEAASVQGSAAVHAPGIASPQIAAQRVAFDSAWNAMAERVRRRDAVAVPGALAAARPWSARRVTAADSGQRRIVLAGFSSHQGLLLVDGDLVVRGTLQLRGLLAVRGSLDVTSGALDVVGGVLLRDTDAGVSHAGSGVRVRYSPCTVRRALASVARPAIAPYGLWIAR